MKKSGRPVRFSGQHFTVSRNLIDDAIRYAGINHDDTVLDIGAGKGSLTAPLAGISGRVYAIEKDAALAHTLRRRFSRQRNVEVVHNDFRNVSLPTQRFRVVSNIPYGITSDILKTLMFRQTEYFAGGTLIIGLNSAMKMFSPEIFNARTIFYHTFFQLKIIYEVDPGCFMPPPTVWSALLQIRRRNSPAVCISLKNEYIRFLDYLLGKPQMPARTALKRVFRKSQVRELLHRHAIDPDRNITGLTANQWSLCFRAFLDMVPIKARRIP